MAKEKKVNYIPYLLYFPGQGPQLVQSREQLVKILGNISYKRYGKAGAYFTADGINLLMTASGRQIGNTIQFEFRHDAAELPGVKIVQYGSGEEAEKERFDVYIEETIKHSFAEG